MVTRTRGTRKKKPHLQDPDIQPTTVKPHNKSGEGSKEDIPVTMTRSIAEGKPSYVPLTAIYWREGRMVGAFTNCIYEQ